MTISGIICEYNPFHNGHMYQIEQTRRAGATHIVAVMSGNFVQRGDCAIMSKWQRAKSAIENGVDVVVELPCPYAISSAESFALGAVSILDSMGCIDMLSFGSESGDIDMLKEVASIADGIAHSSELVSLMEDGLTYPAAMGELMREINSEYADIISSPNNVLGIEYLRALSAVGSTIRPLTIGRAGVEHDSMNISDQFASASMIRKMLHRGSDVSALMPHPPIDVDDFVKLKNLENAILYKMRSMTANEIVNIPDVAHGLENRIYNAARNARSIDELFDLIKTKRYTAARIRRIIICCLLNINKNDLNVLPPYVRIIGISKFGGEVLRRARLNCKLPISSSLARLAEHGGSAKKFADIETFSSDIFALAYKNYLPCGSDYTHKMLKNFN
ncbi:MAG: nucleotidyltransferase [Clostridiales bacterium]|nr:nucleotidyltransferase [Clostridiales bacterium]